MNEPDEFIRMLYGDDPLPGKLVVSSYAPSKRAVWCDNIPQAATILRKWGAETNAYFGVGLQGGKQESPAARGAGDTVIAIPGTFADVDYGDKGNGKQYPATVEEVLSLLNRMPFPPSLIADTGGGTHAYWLMAELWAFDFPGDRHQGERVCCGWQRLLQQKARERGQVIDSTFDLARVLRAAGTVNHNYNPPRRVKILEYHPDRRYLLEDFEPYIGEEFDAQELNGFVPGSFAIPPSEVPVASLGNAFEACLANSVENGIFRDVWERRKKFGDGSPSVYTFMLACHLFRAGATSQEIVNACMSWRYRFGTWDKKHTTAGWWELELKRIAAKAEKDPPIRTSAPAKAEIPPIPLCGDLCLRIDSEKRTDSGKLVVGAKLWSGDQPISLIQVSSAACSQKDAIKALKRYISPAAGSAETGPAVDVEDIVTRILVDADRRLSEQANRLDEKLESVLDILFREVPPLFDMKFRTSSGKLWSNKWGREVSRQEFTTTTPAKLIELTKSGHDSEDSDAKQIKTVRELLGVVWATLLATLPPSATEATTESDRDTPAAKRFEADLYRVWTSPVLFKSVPVGNGSENGPVRASLASLVTELFDPIKNSGRMPDRPKWVQIRSSVAAWWRPGMGEGGMLVPYLAMRFDLFDHLRIPCEWATDQKSFKQSGGRWGLFADDGCVRGRLTDGKWLAVLSARMREQILSQPTNEPDEECFADDEKAADDSSNVREEDFHAAETWE